MGDIRYRVIFKGEAAPGEDVNEVKTKVASIFKADQEKIERLFSGATIVIKKDADLETCEKVSNAIKKAGAVSYIEEERPTDADDMKPSQDKEPLPPPLPPRRASDEGQAADGPRIKRPDEKYCPGCGEIIQIKALHCPYCGKKQRKEGIGCLPVAVIVIGISMFAFVIIGILAAIAIPQFAAYRTRAYEESVKNELRNLYTAEDLHYQDNGRYSDSLRELGFEVSNTMVTVEILSADEYCFDAVGDMDALATTLWIDCSGEISER